MGDMADWEIDNGIENWDGFYDDENYPRTSYQTCKYCKARGLHWQQTKEGKWRLFNSLNKLHECLLIDGRKP